LNDTRYRMDVALALCAIARAIDYRIHDLHALVSCVLTIVCTHRIVKPEQ